LGFNQIGSAAENHISEERADKSVSRDRCRFCLATALKNLLDYQIADA
jgi:hypothetical protein